MSYLARWECEDRDCRRLLGEVDRGRLRLARSVETVYATRDGCVVLCPGCEKPRIWHWDSPQQPDGASSVMVR